MVIFKEIYLSWETNSKIFIVYLEWVEYCLGIESQATAMLIIVVRSYVSFLNFDNKIYILLVFLCSSLLESSSQKTKISF